MDNLLLVWVMVAAVALGIDLATSNFFFVSFTLGGICAIIANLLGGNDQIQIILFIVISGLCLAVGYPLVKKTLKKTVEKTPTQEEGYIGRKFKIEQDLGSEERASLKFEGIYWTVRCEGEPLKKGDWAEIVGLEGNKLLIKKTEGE